MNEVPMKLLSRTAILALAALFGLTLYNCGGDNSTPTTPSSPGTTADVMITIQGQAGNMSFSPNPATVRAGQTVAWRNADSLTHTATQDASGFDTGNITAGATSTPILFNTAGSLSYHCSIHPSMVGTVTVN
jgi:plastocyanin